VSWPGESRDRELRLLASLLRAVVRAGFTRVTVLDAVPCLILTGASGVAVRVGVDASGTAFALDAPGWQSPTGDMPGAARALIAFVESVDCAGSAASARSGVRP
jgi:hypothetical protein